MAHWRLAVANQFVPVLTLLAFREFFALQAEVERQSEHGDDAPLTTADAAKVIAFLAALSVGGAWSFGGLAAVGCWLVTGRGPGDSFWPSASSPALECATGFKRSSHNRAAPRATDLHCRISSL